jgi:broad specificity phosphatase PhoE
MTRLLLIRHGQSAANAEGRLQGRLDSSLSDRGREESARLAERLAELEVAALYASPLLRAYETAQIVCIRLGTAIERHDGLMERDVGALTGLTPEEARARFAEAAGDRVAGQPLAIPGFEQDEPFAERVRGVFDEILQAHGDGTVAVITHGGVIGSYLRQTLGIPLGRRGPFSIDNTSITTIEAGDGAGARPRLQLVGLNDRCHLDGLREE